MIIIILLIICFLILILILSKIRLKVVLLKEKIKSNINVNKHLITDKKKQKSKFTYDLVRSYFVLAIKRLKNCSIKELSCLLLLFIVITTFLMTSSSKVLIPYFVFKIFCTITFLAVLIFPIYYIKKGFEKNSKMETYLIILIVIISYSTYSLKAFTGNSFRIVLFYCLLIPAILYYLCLFIAIIKSNLSVASKFILLIFLYAIAITTGSFIFGTYYCFIFPDEYPSQIIAINSTNDLWQQVKLFSCIGLPKFFSFPSDNQITNISIFQYFWGKILELCFLGYIVSEIFNLGYQKQNSK